MCIRDRLPPVRRLRSSRTRSVPRRLRCLPQWCRCRTCRAHVAAQTGTRRSVKGGTAVCTSRSSVCPTKSTSRRPANRRGSSRCGKWPRLGEDLQLIIGEQPSRHRTPTGLVGAALRPARDSHTDDPRPYRRRAVAPEVIRVFLVDDHEVVRRGLAALLDTEDDIEVVGEAGTVADAMARVPAVRPAVVVLDVRLPDGNGVALCRDLRSVLPEAGYLMLTSFSDDEALFDAILAGAAGYLLKQIRGNDLVDAVRTVASGRSLLDPAVTQRVLERLRNPPAPDAKLASLTVTERKILDLIGEGLTNRQIAERIYLAEKTVKNYVSYLLAKLGVERRTQAALYVVESHHDARQRPGC